MAHYRAAGSIPRKRHTPHRDRDGHLYYEGLTGEEGFSDLIPLGDVQLHLPFEVGDYVDFYSSEHHARNVGAIFRPGAEPLSPNWSTCPSATTGERAPSSCPVRRSCALRVRAGPDQGSRRSSGRVSGWTSRRR